MGPNVEHILFFHDGVYISSNICMERRRGPEILLAPTSIRYRVPPNSFVGPQNAPLHNMLLLVAYCVPCIHNMLRWSILCTLHTQYATRGAYCVGSVHMLFQWSSEGTQYAFLENMSRGMFAFLSNCPLDIHLSILRTLYLKT